MAATPTIAAMSEPLSYRFGAFRLVPDRRSLYEGERPLKLGARALDLLQVLVERRERVVSKDEMLELVWPGLVVEENNLQVHVAALRKLLGHPAISTVPGRGYRFTMPVQVQADAAGAPPPAPAQASPRSNAGPELVGRDAELAQLIELLNQHRLVTVAGAGGIGKTCLAQAAAARLGLGGLCWIDLAALADADLLPRAIGRALGNSVDGAEDASDAVLRLLDERAPLLVLDNAEHLLDPVAAFVDRLLRQAPRSRVLVTSQEVLRLDGEQVLRVPPLSLPIEHDLQAAGASGAVALFVARASTADPRFRLGPDNVAAVIDICRRLDGIALALVLAAGRVALLGVEGVRARLNERFQLLTAGARVALRRHQTLRAALEWTFGLLDPDEQAVFRRLGCFVGGFGLEAAQSVCADDSIDHWDVLEHLGSLVDKSIVQVEGDAVPRYRMLDTTRLFAVEQLAQAGETDCVLRRHAQTMAELIQGRNADLLRWQSGASGFEADAAEADNVRAALDWAIRHGDPALAVDVAARAAVAFIRADLVNEFSERARPLRARLDESIPTTTRAMFWLRLAAAGTKSNDADALDAARRAIDTWQRLDAPHMLYEALSCGVLIGAYRREAPALPAWLEQLDRIEQAEWPPALLSYGRWARYRMLRRSGQEEQARAMAEQQVQLSAQRDPIFTLRIEGANLVDCEIALGLLTQAEARARDVLRRLQAAGVDDTRIGPVHEGLAIALTGLGRFDEARAVAREARRRLRADGDDLRLLDPLACIAAQAGHVDEAAMVTGHVDFIMGRQGLLRWPAAASRRAALDGLLLQRLGEERLAAQRRLGVSLSRDAAYKLMLD